MTPTLKEEVRKTDENGTLFRCRNSNLASGQPQWSWLHKEVVAERQANFFKWQFDLSEVMLWQWGLKTWNEEAAVRTHVNLFQKIKYMRLKSYNRKRGSPAKNLGILDSNSWLKQISEAKKGWVILPDFVFQEYRDETGFWSQTARHNLATPASDFENFEEDRKTLNLLLRKEKFIVFWLDEDFAAILTSSASDVCTCLGLIEF